MDRMVSLEDSVECSYESQREGWHGLTASAPLTDIEREFLAPYREAFFCDRAEDREVGVRLESPESAEEVFNGLEDEPDVWWNGEDRVRHNRSGEIVEADGLLPSERLRRKPVVRL